MKGVDAVQRRTIKTWLQMKKPEEGGRGYPISAEYCPDLRTLGVEALIPVRVREVCVSARSGQVDPGSTAIVRFEFVYPDLAANEALVVGVPFEVLEGPKIIGLGEVMAVETRMG